MSDSCRVASTIRAVDVEDYEGLPMLFGWGQKFVLHVDWGSSQTEAQTEDK